MKKEYEILPMDLTYEHMMICVNSFVKSKLCGAAQTCFYSEIENSSVQDALLQSILNDVILNAIKLKLEKLENENNV